MPNYNKSQLQELLSNLVDEKLGEQELKELQALLRDDPDAQQFYIRYTMLHSWLTWDYIEQSPAESRLLSLNKQMEEESAKSPILDFLGDVTNSTINFFNNHSPLSFVLFFAFFGMTLLATSFWLTAPNNGNVPAESGLIARISAAKDCKWSTTPAPPTELRAGRILQLEKGILQITYSNKAMVLLEGPVSYKVESANSGFLSHGKLTARADTEESRQFTIVTPNARFVDLGTEFGVKIDEKGRAAVAVFSGKVNAEAKLSDGRWTAPVPVRKGEAMVCVETKFKQQVARRSDFPSLQPPPPPSPSQPYQRWLAANRELQNRQDLVAYYDFQLDQNNPTVLQNRAPTGPQYNGEIQNAAWTEGRFPEKGALNFKDKNAGVRVNLPGEYRQMTFIAWIRNDQLANEYNGILMSDNWKRNQEVHWGIRQNSSVQLCVYGQKLSEDSAKSLPEDSLNKWCMVAGTIDVPNQSSLYLNGEFFENPKSSDMPPVNIGLATIGGGHYDPGEGDAAHGFYYNLSGLMDELMIFNRVLSAEEIKNIYEAGKPSDIPAPQPPVSPAYQRWLDASKELQSHQDLIAYYDFVPDLNNLNVLPNRAQTGAMYNGEIQNARWTEGRFSEKSALEFKVKDAGVRINIPGEYRQMTLIAWVNSKKFANTYNPILFSDGWNQAMKLHWEIRKSGQFELSVYGQKGGSFSDLLFPEQNLDTWCMLAGVIEIPDTSTLYLNGEFFEKLSSVGMPAIQIGPAMIGGWHDADATDNNPIRTLSGRMDELMIFQKALSSEEIKQIYEAGKP